MLNLLSVNIEGKRHLDKIERLIEQVRPVVVCMQEVFEDDIPRLIHTLTLGLGKKVVTYFTPILLKKENDRTIEFGNLIISTLPTQAYQEQYYLGGRDSLKMHRSGIFTDLALVLSSVVVEKDETTFQIATTHFCKSESGNITSDFQRMHIRGLLEKLEALNECIVCGDFNAPRGGEIFTMLANRYTDNINSMYTTSLDPDLHRAGPLPYMVDGLFTTPEYKVTHMHFETGVSDHYAIVASIERT